MTKVIPLTQGKSTLVDDEDYEKLNKHKWYAHLENKIWYAVRDIKLDDGKRTIIRLHREIVNVLSGKDVDHINHDGLDNRKCNLRICTRSQNISHQRKHKNNTSDFRGVYWYKKKQKWMAYITIERKRITIGYFDDKVEAGHIVDQFAIQLFGEFAMLNFLSDDEARFEEKL